MGTAANFCIRCGARLPSPAPNYCTDCGSQVDAAEKSGFHRLRSRWLLLVLPLSLAAGSVDTLVDGQYLTYLVLVGWTALVLVRKRVSVVRLLGRVPHGFNWWPIPLLAVAGIVFSLGAVPVVWHPLARVAPDIVSDVLSQPLAGSRLNIFVLIVIAAPLSEELLFRGLLFSRLMVKWGATRAMIVSSLAFGLLHLNPIGASVFGMVACVLYLRTRTLLAPMALHALNNLMVWFVTFWEVEADVPYDSPEFLYQGVVAMLIASPVILLFLRRWWPARGTALPYDTN